MSGSDGLMDFASGALTGGTAGAKASGGNPWVAGGSALALGALSYFGGASQRSLEDKNNRLALEGMQQDNTLGKLSIIEARRQTKANKEKDQRKELFSQMLAQYFQKQGGK